MQCETSVGNFCLHHPFREDWQRLNFIDSLGNIIDKPDLLNAQKLRWERRLLRNCLQASPSLCLSCQSFLFSRVAQASYCPVSLYLLT